MGGLPFLKEKRGVVDQGKRRNWGTGRRRWRAGCVSDVFYERRINKKKTEKNYRYTKVAAATSSYLLQLSQASWISP